MKWLMHSAGAAALLMVACGNAFADDPDPLAPLAPPDPKTVTLPNMNALPLRGESRHFDRAFYFYKPGVSFETAFADLDRCRIYAESAQLTALPRKFVPLGGAELNENRPLNRTTLVVVVPRAAGVSASGAAVGAAAGGLIGAALVYGIVEETKEALKSGTDRRCMAYKGYQRYGTWRSIYNKIEDGTETDKIARLALIASGPQPQARVIEP